MFNDLTEEPFPHPLSNSVTLDNVNSGVVGATGVTLGLGDILTVSSLSVPETHHLTIDFWFMSALNNGTLTVLKQAGVPVVTAEVLGTDILVTTNETRTFPHGTTYTSPTDWSYFGLTVGWDGTSNTQGRIDVWVGTYGPSTCSATLEMETWYN